ncbi:MAG TPA: TolC family protein [Bryobacteraceae bacterium]|nr:TolC family protein [Bryobacteraceae bacterium]
MAFRFLAAGLLLAAPVLAQISSFPKPSYFRETFSSSVPKVELRPPVRLPDFVVNGKLELSLRSYLELVMANNTDIAIQRLSVETFQNAITRAFGVFDPVATGSFTSQRQTTPSNSYLTGANTLVQLNQPARFTYSQLLDSGMTYQGIFAAQKISTNSGFQNYNPALTSNLGVNFTQPLIKNRGRYVNRLPIMIARSRLRKSEYDLRASLLQMVNDAENAYWNVILARENLRVAESALDLADQALKRAQLELKLGALSPLDIYNPQQQYATAEILVSQARFSLQQQEDALRKQIAADLDPDIRKLPIVLTESVMPATDEPPLDAEMEVEKALTTRPDLKSAMQSLDVDDLQIKSAKNSLLPDLSLTGSYTSQGQGGTFYQRTNVFTTSGTQSQIVKVLPGTFGDSLGQMFGFGYPLYYFGLTLRLPIRNRAAAADLADAVLAKRRDALTIRTTEQQVRLDILQAVSQVESSKAAVKLAVVAQDFARKYLEAEQKKYELGTSQIFFVLQAQQALVSAESAVVQNSVQYRKNLLNLLRRTGELLDARDIAVQ